MKLTYANLLKGTIVLVFVTTIIITFFLPSNKAANNGVLQAQTEEGYGNFFTVAGTREFQLNECGANYATITTYTCIYDKLPYGYKPCSKNIYHYVIRNIALQCWNRCRWSSCRIPLCMPSGISCPGCDVNPNYNACGIGSGISAIVDSDDPLYLNKLMDIPSQCY
jgi:hypothetical protein